MGQLFGNTTNTGIADPQTGQIQWGNAAQSGINMAKTAAKYAQPESANVDDSGVTFEQPMSENNPTKINLPFAKAAGSGPGGTLNAMSPALTTKGKVLAALIGGATGGLSAAGSRTVGEGFQRGQQAPFINAMNRQDVERGALQNEMLQQQMRYFPLIQQLGIQKTQAEIGKESAQAQHAQAQASGQQYVDALNQARQAAERYKEVNGVLYDVSGPKPQPVQGAAGQFVPADEQMAKIGGIKVGDLIPVNTAQKLKSMANEGIRPVQANGRSMLVDNTGKTIADLGAATPVVTMNMMNPFAGTKTPFVSGESALQGLNPEQAAIVRGVANYTIDPDKLPLYRSPQAKFTLLSLVKAYNPDYDETRYGAKASFFKSAIGGKIGDEINAYNTAIAHADLLQQAMSAMANGDNRTLNSIKNSWQKEFGSSLPTNFNTIAHVYTGEVTKVTSAGHVTDSELHANGATIPDNASPEQQLGAVNAYKALMLSKMQQRQQQAEAAMQGQINFGGATTAPPPGSRPVMVNGKLAGYTTDGKTMTPVQ